MLTERAAKLTYISHNWKILERNIENEMDDSDSEQDVDVNPPHNIGQPFILEHRNPSSHCEDGLNLDITQSQDEASDLESANYGSNSENYSLHDTDTSLGLSCNSDF